MLLTFNLFFWLIIIRIIISWVSSGGYNPAVAMVYSLTEPLLRPFRRIVPSLGGLDISPVFAIILLLAATIIVSGFRTLPF